MSIFYGICERLKLQIVFGLYYLLILKYSIITHAHHQRVLQSTPAND